jgi:hypothetical protein
MIQPHIGEVAEWSNVPDSKSGVAYSVTEGSNPSLSANYLENTPLTWHIVCILII